MLNFDGYLLAPYQVVCSYHAQIWHEYCRGMPWLCKDMVLQFKNDLLDTVRHNTLPMVKYPSIIVYRYELEFP